MKPARPRAFWLWLVPVLSGACVGPASPDGRGDAIRVTAVATARGIGPTSRNGVALLHDSVACVIQAYETRVICGDVTWDQTYSVGRAGDGPGEFRRISQIRRAEGGALAVVDGRLRRVTFFQSGVLVLTVSTPALFRLLDTPAATVLLGSSQLDLEMDLTKPGATIHRVMPLSPDLNKSTQIAHESRLGAHAFPHGVRLNDGGYLFYAGDSILALYDAQGRFREEVVVTNLGSGLPTDWDVEQYVRDMRTGFADVPSAEDLADFKKRRLPALLPGIAMVRDTAGLVWIARREGGGTASFLEVRNDSAVVEVVELPGRMLAFDLLGTTLVVLRDPDLPSAELALDWYRVQWSAGRISSKDG